VQYGSAALLPPYEIAAILRSVNLQPLSRPARDGDYYLVRAVNWRGQVVRVTIDGWRGRVVQVEPLYARRWSPPGRFGAIAPYYRESYPPLPPRGLPQTARRPLERIEPLRDARGEPEISLDTRQRSAAITTADPPLPRPRPPLLEASPGPGTDVTATIPPPAAKPVDAPPASRSPSFPPMTPLE
jgi:hypothetical protein